MSRLTGVWIRTVKGIDKIVKEKPQNYNDTCLSCNQQVPIISALRDGGTHWVYCWNCDLVSYYPFRGAPERKGPMNRHWFFDYKSALEYEGFSIQMLDSFESVYKPPINFFEDENYWYLGHEDYRGYGYEFIIEKETGYLIDNTGSSRKPLNYQGPNLRKHLEENGRYRPFNNA